MPPGVIYFGASYHADYTTILCAPADLPAVARRWQTRYATTSLGRGRPAPTARDRSRPAALEYSLRSALPAGR